MLEFLSVVVVVKWSELVLIFVLLLCLSLHSQG